MNEIGSSGLPPSQFSVPFGEGSDDIDIADIGRSLIRRWRVIAVITVLVFLAALYLVLFARPQFAINGALYLGDAQSGGPQTVSADTSDNNFLSAFQNFSDVQTQTQLIQSKALVERAILETGLNASIEPVGKTSLPYWKWYLFHHRAIQAFAPADGDMSVLYATLADPGSRGAAYKVVFGNNGSYRLVTVGGWFHPSKTVLTGTLNKPASGSGMDFLMKSETAPPKGAQYILSITPAKALADSLLGGPLVATVVGSTASPTQLASVQLKWGNPYSGQMFVNTLMADFIATQLSWKTQSASNTEEFVSAQLDKIRSSLAQADQNLAAYQSQTGIVDVPANAQAVISQLSQYEVQRTGIYLQQQSLQQLAASMSQGSATLNPYLVSQTNDTVLAQLAGNLAAAEVQLQALQVQYTGSTPAVQIQQATIARLQSAMRSLITNDANLATKNLANIDALIDKYQHELKSMPAQSLQVVALTRSSDVLGQLYVLLMQKQQEAEVSKAATIVGTRVVTPAEIPLYATQPKPQITILAGIFLGLFLGVSVVLIQRATSSRFQSDDEIRRTVPLPIYSTIPKRLKPETNAGIVSSDSRSTFAEAFRLMRTNLYRSFVDKRPKIIMLISTSNAEGRTMIAANLAKALADDEKRVLFMNADMHCPWPYKQLATGTIPGLRDWLALGTKPEFKKLDGQGFFVLPAGTATSNSSELLNRTRLREVFDALRQEFDFVVVDCPPLPASSDGLTLASHADVILSVLEVEATARRAFSLHNHALGASGHLRGVVINGVVASRHDYSYVCNDPGGPINIRRYSLLNRVFKSRGENTSW